jgi:hypothetical protein
MVQLTLKAHFAPPHAQTLMEALLLGHELNNLIVVKNAELGLNHKFWVEQLEHETQGPGNVWTTKLLLSRVPEATKTYWLFETAGFGEMGETTRMFA